MSYSIFRHQLGQTAFIEDRFRFFREELDKNTQFIFFQSFIKGDIFDA